MARKTNSSSSFIERLSSESKNFYSAGTTFTTATCGATVLIAWQVLGRFSPQLKADWVGFMLSFLIVLAYAFVIPEPEGYENAGKLKITSSELIFSVFNTFIVFSIAVGFNCWLTSGMK